MRKKFLIMIGVLCLTLCGCGDKTKEDILNDISKKINNLDSYYLTGTLEMLNNETTYSYDVTVAYTKENSFKVNLKNKSNNHEQIILRNDQGVYVVTPSLNKSFKFQSEWPYNNSQAYLLQTIIEDIENDKDYTYTNENDKHIFISTVNYSNNSSLVKQKVVFDKDYKVEEVNVLDADDTVRIKMSFNEIDFKPKFSKDYYSLEQNVSSVDSESSSASSLEDIIYPMYIPVNTTLSTQDKIKTQNGERVILTFDGENPFTFIQENVTIMPEFSTIPVNGELVMINDAIGIVDESSVTWISDDIEYYLVSSTLNTEELLEVALSIGSVPVIK